MITESLNSEVSDECAYDTSCNIREAHRIFLKQGWGEWMCSGVLDNN